MLSARSLIKSDLELVASQLGFGQITVLVERSQVEQRGDYSSNVALQLAKTTQGKGYHSPMEIAKKIVEHFPKKDYLDRVVVAEPGFVNFFLDKGWLSRQVAEIEAAGSQFGDMTTGQDKLARVEFVSANPTGPLHIGNARGGPLGDAIANILTKAGYRVIREYIHNDVGGQVEQFGKTLAAKIGYPTPPTVASQQQELSYQGNYIEFLASKVKKAVMAKVGDDYQALKEAEFEQLVGQCGVEIMFEEIIDDCQTMGIEFDVIVKESQLRKKAGPILEKLQQQGSLTNKDGAMWFAPNDQFLKDRETVVIKSDGGYTYFTADIVYHQQKFASGADLVIDVFGSNHAGHLPRLQAVVAALGYDLSKFKVILYQYVRVKRGETVIKMSKRAGNFIAAAEVLNEVGRDAFRFFLLSVAPNTHLDFDLELAQKHSADNPVFYVQYAHARIASILDRAKDKMGHAATAAAGFTLEHPSELKLVKKLLQFPELVEDISRSLAVHQLTTYAQSLADCFHQFYEQCPVLSGDQRITLIRLKLVRSTQIVLQQTLGLLGISAPERM